MDNNRLLKERVNRIRAAKVKLPSVKLFMGEKLKLKGFIVQISFKVIQEGVKLAILIDRVTYVGLFLLGRALKQFKLYLIEIQKNGTIITNNDVKYIFSSQEGFIDQLI